MLIVINYELNMKNFKLNVKELFIKVSTFLHIILEILIYNINIKYSIFSVERLKINLPY